MEPPAPPVSSWYSEGLAWGVRYVWQLRQACGPQAAVCGALFGACCPPRPAPPRPPTSQTPCDLFPPASRVQGQQMLFDILHATGDLEVQEDIIQLLWDLESVSVGSSQKVGD